MKIDLETKNKHNFSMNENTLFSSPISLVHILIIFVPRNLNLETLRRLRLNGIPDLGGGTDVWIAMSEDRTSTTVASEDGDVRPPSNHSTSRKRIKIIPPKRDGNSRMVASEVGSPSNHSTSMKRAKPSPGPQPPRVQLKFDFDGLVLKGDFDKDVAVALSSFNETNQAQGAPLYEVVKALGFIWTPIAKTCHFNFIARPKDGTDAEDKLFFAEVETVRGVGYRCNCCCIIGPPDSKTGLCGCGIYCVHHPNHVQHPPQGGFRKKLIIGGDFLW